MASPWIARSSTRGAAHSMPSWTVPIVQRMQASVRPPGPTASGRSSALTRTHARSRAATPNITPACCARTAARVPTARRSDGKGTARSRRAVRRLSGGLRSVEVVAQAERDQVDVDFAGQFVRADFRIAIPAEPHAEALAEAELAADAVDHVRAVGRSAVGRRFAVDRDGHVRIDAHEREAQAPEH